MPPRLKPKPGRLRRACGYLPDGVVNSTNLGSETAPETILESLPQADALAEKLDIPVAATALDAFPLGDAHAGTPGIDTGPLYPHPAGQALLGGLAARQNMGKTARYRRERKRKRV